MDANGAKPSHDNNRWTEGGPTAPVIIPVLFFGVIITALICLLVKYLLQFYDKKRKSDTYVFVDRIDDLDADAGRIKIEPIDASSDVKLNSLVFMDEKRKISDSTSSLEIEVPSFDGSKERIVSVEVSPSQNNSTETHNTSVDDIDYTMPDGDLDEGGSNTETLPLTKKKRQEPANTTESDV